MDQRFTVVPTSLLFSDKLSVSAKILYCLLSSWGQKGRGMVWPDQQTLAEASGLGVRQINRLLNDLESAGVIRRVRTMKSNGHFGRNEYELLGFEVSVKVGREPSDTDVTRPPSDTDVPDHRTLVTESIGHGCPIENKTTDQEQKIKNSASRRFTPPSMEEVEQYFLSKKLTRASAAKLADRFINYYESVGWMVGPKKKMVSWKGSAGGWVSRGLERGEIQLETTTKGQRGLFG